MNTHCRLPSHSQPQGPDDGPHPTRRSDPRTGLLKCNAGREFCLILFYSSTLISGTYISKIENLGKTFSERARRARSLTGVAEGRSMAVKEPAEHSIPFYLLFHRGASGRRGGAMATAVMPAMRQSGKTTRGACSWATATAIQKQRSHGSDNRSLHSQRRTKEATSNVSFMPRWRTSKMPPYYLSMCVLRLGEMRRVRIRLSRSGRA